MKIKIPFVLAVGHLPICLSATEVAVAAETRVDVVAMDAVTNKKQSQSKPTLLFCYLFCGIISIQYPSGSSIK